eukprot:CAMPEP_0172301698 /NCGR_PEP_ID=MMETSP1058-20130122/3539_1 /TAXON_ID=83371 /ORGANISM="Detonula confervacea, Strain CCMP 353" /LENGTH=75 /DNA_ID=CAMNT_0013011913 /DNA_START=88 /DNA_END=312 /DNA_ORIENTATION=+
MQLSIALFLTAAATTSAFAPVPLSSRSSSPLRVATDIKEAAAADLAGAKDGQAEVVLVGCGAPNRGMGWYHAVQM